MHAGRKKSKLFLRNAWVKLAFASLVVLLSVLIVVVNAGVYVIYDSKIVAKPQAPPLILVDPEAQGVNVTLGANDTWANITVKATTEYQEITRNGGFDTSPNGWLYGYTVYSGNATVAAAWNQTYYFAPGASGVVLLYMKLYNPSSIIGYVNGSIYLVQNVTIPNTPLSSVTLNITYYSAYTTSFSTLRSYYLFAELLYTNGTIAWSSLQSVTTGSWNNASFVIPTANVKPGETYTLLVGARVSGRTLNILTIVGNLTIYQLFDSVRLYVEPLYPSFSGSILDVNVTNGNYGGSLGVANLTLLGGTNVNVSVFLANLSGGVTTPIVVSSGLLTSSATSEVQLTVPPLGYTSGYIHLSASIYSSSVVNIPLRIRYGVGGVTVTYQVNITIIDPPSKNVTVSSTNNVPHQYAHTHLGRDKSMKGFKHLDKLLPNILENSIPLQRWRG